MRFCGAGLVTFFASGCFHVDLGAAPAPQAPLAERVAAYQRLRPAGLDREITIANNFTTVTVASSLTLADGTSIAHADDLLPVLDPSSPAAQAARASASARQAKWIAEIGGSVVMAGGMVYALGGSDDDDLEAFDRRMTIGLGILTAGGVAVLLGMLYFRPEEERQRRSAFHTYAESLRTSLQLCVDGLNLVDCQATPHVGAPGAVQP